MKKIFLLTFLLSLLFISCRNVVESDSFNQNSNWETVTFYISTTSHSRSITPSKLLFTEIDFYLSAKNISTNLTSEPQLIELVSYDINTSTGVFTLPYEKGNYEFTLSAYEKSKPRSTETLLLQGKTFCNLYLENEVHFHLSSSLKISSFGKANLYIYTNGWQLNDPENPPLIATVGIYDMKNGNALHEQTYFPLQNFYHNTENEIPNPLIYNYDPFPTSIKSGTHIFKVTLTNTENGKSFYYTDTLFIEHNRTTEAAIGIPKIISKIPESPSNLQMSFTPPSSADETYCPITFTWEDNSNTESNFVLEINSDKGLKEKFIIPANIQSYSLYFFTDRIFSAKLYASSSAGDSSFIEQNDLIIPKYNDDLTPDEKIIEQKHRFDGSKNLFIYTDDDNTFSPENELILDQLNRCTISKGTKSYIYFVLRNVFATDEDNTGLGVINAVYKDVCFSVFEQGSIPNTETDVYNFPNITGTPIGYNSLGGPSAQHAYLCKSLNEFEIGKTYNITIKATSVSNEKIKLKTTMIVDFVE